MQANCCKARKVEQHNFPVAMGQHPCGKYSHEIKVPLFST
jgi:hypothetical protein